MLACRTCNQIFLNTHSLIQHYESHECELNQRAQNHQTNPFLSSLRESRERNLTNNPSQPRLSNSSTLQQRYHPYLPTGFRMLQRERISTPQNSLNLATAQTHNLPQPRNPVANNNPLRASAQLPNWISGRNVAGGNPFVIPHRLSPEQNSAPQRALFPKSQEQKGQLEAPEKRTFWFLGQLEKPIPTLIDLESENELHESLNLDLTL
ncbi:Replicase polyprotein 1ab [Bienertia sinuspersici]